MSTKLKKGNKNRYFWGNTRGTEGVEKRNSGKVYCADRKLLPRIKQVHWSCDVSYDFISYCDIPLVC